MQASGRIIDLTFERKFLTPKALRNAYSFSVHGCCATALSLLGLAAMATPAHAASSVALTGRVSDLYLSEITGGVGTAHVSINPSPNRIQSTILAPSFLQLAGSDTDTASNGAFNATIDAVWDLQQDYAIQNAGSGVVLSALGSLSVTGGSSGSSSGVPSAGPFDHHQYNYQTLRFSLSQESGYTLAGTTWGGEYIRLVGTSVIIDGSATYGVDETPRAWSFSGILAAGDYVISNRLVGLGNSGWGYALTFQDAQVAAVPEPETVALMLAGLALVGFAARRRRG